MHAHWIKTGIVLLSESPRLAQILTANPHSFRCISLRRLHIQIRVHSCFAR